MPIEGVEFGIGRRTSDQVGKGVWATGRGAVEIYVLFSRQWGRSESSLANLGPQGPWEVRG